MFTFATRSYEFLISVIFRLLESSVAVDESIAYTCVLRNDCRELTFVVAWILVGPIEHVYSLLVYCMSKLLERLAVCHPTFD